MGRTFDMTARKLWLGLMGLFVTARATNCNAQQLSQKPNILLRFGFLLLATTVGGVELAAAAEREMPKFDIAAVCRGGGAANYTKLLSCLQAASIEETPKDPWAYASDCEMI